MKRKAQSCDQEPKRARHDELELRKQRTSDWFSKAFLPSTNEKEVIALAMERFIKLILDKTDVTSYTVMDIGCGEGELSAKIARTLMTRNLKLRYSGIDIDADFVGKTREKLANLGVETQIVVGDCFSQDLDQLPANPSLILASHVGYYARDVKDFVSTLISKMGSNSILIFVHASHLSMHNILRVKYYSPVDTRVELQIDQAVKSHDLAIFNIMFSAAIFYKFGNQGLTLIATSAYDSLTSEQLVYRQLLEFTVQRPMEALGDEAKLDEYTREVSAIIERQMNKMLIWCSMQVVVPSDSKYLSSIRSAVCEFISYRDTERFSPIHWAAFEGRLDIVRALVAEVGKTLINLENLGILTPLYMVALGSSRSCHKEQFLKTAEFLINEGSDSRSIALAKEVAEQYSDSALSELLDCYLNKAVIQARLPVIIKSLVPKIEILDWLEGNMFLLFDEGNYYSDELIESALKSNSIEVLEWIKQHKPNLLTRTFTYNKKNAAHIAAESFDAEVNSLGWLEAHGFERLILDVDRKGNTIMYYLAINNKLNDIERLNVRYENLLNKQTLINIVANKKVSMIFLDWVMRYKPELIAGIGQGETNFAHLAIKNENLLLLDWVKTNFPKQLLFRDHKNHHILYYSVQMKSIKLLEWLRINQYKLLAAGLVNYTIVFDHAEILDWILANCIELITDAISNERFLSQVMNSDKVKSKEWLLKYIRESHPQIAERLEQLNTQDALSQATQSQHEPTLSQIIEREKTSSQEKLIAERPGYFLQQIMSRLKAKLDQKQTNGTIFQAQVVYDNALLNSPSGNELLMQAYKMGGHNLYDLVFELGTDADTAEEIFKIINEQGIETLLYRLLGREAVLRLDTEQTIESNFSKLIAEFVKANLPVEKIMEWIQVSVNYILPEQESDRIIAFRDFAFILLESLLSNTETFYIPSQNHNPGDPNDQGGFGGNETENNFNWLAGNLNVTI